MNQRKLNDSSVVAHVQAVLDAASVEVFVAGRAQLNERASLRFVADQAALNGRSGFALDGVAEKYEIRGGVTPEEVDDVFRSAGGDRAVRDVTVAARQWLKGENVAATHGLPVWVRDAVREPASPQAATALADSVRAGKARSYGEAAVIRPTTPEVPERGKRR